MRVLVVEDQDELREVVAETLREESFAVDESADGEEGLYKALNWDYDIVVLDVMMPMMDGWEVLEKLRREKQTPVLMLTALDQVRDKVKGLNHGADDYLAKPFDLTELVARVRAVMRRKGGDHRPEVTVGNVTINTTAKTLRLGDKEVEVTAREFAMAELMIKHRDEVVTRDFLYDHLFDENDESMSNMLDVYVYKLRQKFGKNFIKTRRGQGYIVESI
ncbi:response regulator transcription factor [Akkermansiaceae bacterium]|jgi:two-component system OmpR family response regulator|nr:response regulator transcription factor [Akkermansiaceae bacterium]MDA7907604.1 response regulator transcription factor [Akkermansiaceae bacterium]MDA7930080.1 response regulator transcription factor [Akkermansiaceae bacterium]MDA8976791.1 response regulator transcription factor [bacterium]MDF1712894.1 response regulator transcription factor [Akkermansiaceae bacterium]